LGFWGQGGIGKTDHAISIAQDEQVRRAFPDGVYWVAVGQRPDILGLQRDLLDRLGLAAAPTSAIEARAALAGAVRDRHVLFVVDDVWSTAAADAFRVTADSARVLYTTRSEQVLGDVGAEVHRIDVLSEAVARRLLAETANILVDDLPDDAVTQILASTGRVALAVALAGATIRRSGLAFHEVVLPLRMRRFLITHTPTHSARCGLRSTRSMNRCGRHIWSWRRSRRTRQSPSRPSPDCGPIPASGTPREPGR
jgi:hypothetical protein